MDLPVLESFKNIQLQNQFNNILSSNAKYLAHEYLNQSYEPFDFAKLVAELSQAKLQFASPAHSARLLKPSYFLDKATLNKLNETSPIMQEMLKDLFYRVGYKKDYFIKGKTKLEPLQAEKELLKLSFIYVGKEISYKWKAMGKTFTMHQHVYEPIFEVLKDHSMVSVQEIQDILSMHHKRKAAFNELVDVIVNLKTQGSLQVAREKSAIEQAKHSSDRIQSSHY
ncbi:methyltransferase regulatory domain-containing protein [Helicobacter pylori]|uniref:methyltransferase regulatory domain-containing protein n=1 Tax=Helicobacter pylori TaxID=210 RepID=UPI001E2E812C|nr:methyltransferase regulatory domain-containing protein [Helicobacter pylori]